MAGLDPDGRDPGTGRFTVGTAGRPRGSLNNSTIIARNLLEEQADTFARGLVALALAGDTTALRPAAGHRHCPRRYDRRRHRHRDGERRATDAVRGPELCSIIETQRRAIETYDLETRLLALEKTSPGLARGCIPLSGKLPSDRLYWNYSKHAQSQLAPVFF
ncbi:MAG: hypothetical protein EXQ93_04710 [Alphaproteobacteria bacterium]|nr:hypothetical protein [Alphaproteobacteria bacterium]